MDITLPDSGQTLRPGKLICVGKNYARHAAEIGGSVPSEPMLFLKPSTALVGHGGSIVLPPHSTDVHYEVELVAVIGRGGKNIAVDNALDYVDGYAVGLDMTARDLQQKAKEAGAPDRKSTRLNSSHVAIAYDVFCLKKKNRGNRLM